MATSGSFIGEAPLLGLFVVGSFPCNSGRLEEDASRQGKVKVPVAAIYSYMGYRKLSGPALNGLTTLLVFRSSFVYGSISSNSCFFVVFADIC